MVRLPFKDEPSLLGSSYDTAKRRFLALERSLNRKPEVKAKYIEFMQEFEALGHMSLVKVSAEDRRYQYIIWRNSQSEPLRTLELNTVTYGTAAAPYLAIRSMAYLADQHIDNYKLGARAIKSSFYVNDFLDQHIDNYKLGARAIKSSFYVNDFLGGADTEMELHQINEEVTAILKDGQFELAKWHSNHTSSLFDPLGLVAPIILVAKIILQELWLLKLHWDESVPQGIHTAWTSLLQSLTSLESVAIPRYCLQPATCSLEIQGFCDASIRAYCCCVYARTLGSDGLIKVQLITSKSRVAPTKKLSLPKLELCGAHLLSQLYWKIAGIFADREPTIYLWCDSQIVLHWNRQHSATLSTFVGNRISEIQESTADCHWRHVPTHCNPADLLTRGCTVADLQTSIWFQGPAFLRRDQHHWPKDNKEDIDMEVVQLETRKSAFVVRTVNNPLLSGIRKFSSYFRCLLVVAWMYRFSDRSRKGFLTQSLSPNPTELQRALHCIVWNIQTEHFHKETSLLHKGHPLRNNLNL
ncbi:uncharacterized protein [Drosophila takahashii]|uniref:uncharacterized protein n=1 Tax=Drosophila takahashii TaxID=29030 RepID=UPI003898EE9F